MLRIVHPEGGVDTTPLTPHDGPGRRTTRLVPDRESQHPPGSVSVLSSRVRRVQEENARASALDPEDARAILARRVVESLEGGAAAVLRPEIRSRLVTTGVRMGLRPFDANLVIAIMQDDARLAKAQPKPSGAKVSPGAMSRLGLVRGPAEKDVQTSRAVLGRLAISILLGIALALAFVQWIVGAR
ncbi:MAG: hypothetical protein KF912_05940 [Phycisphaeraceae bacterium]|nr:hypothetical protein [Phycisphaeraceae bacterium]MBX3366840.1 hypothetical protein [Phycisphaeraceae bacterium]